MLKQLLKSPILVNNLLQLTNAYLFISTVADNQSLNTFRFGSALNVLT